MKQQRIQWVMNRFPNFVAGLIWAASLATLVAAEMPQRTSLANPDVRYTVAENPNLVLKRGSIEG